MSDKRAEIERLAASFEHDRLHSKQVARLAEELFDTCSSLHHLDPHEGELLVYAALLHDIGWCEGQTRHHKRAYQLILENTPRWLSARDTAIVANVARYHRKALPKLSHPGFAALLPADREIVRQLAALIRIADGLDVTHSAKVAVTFCIHDTHAASFSIDCDTDCSLEIEAAGEKADLFEEVYGITLTIELQLVKH